MGILLSLMFLGLVCWLSWQTLKNDMRKESVSRDLEDMMTAEAIRRARGKMKERVEEWKEDKQHS